jgi:hypothetical protein
MGSEEIRAVMWEAGGRWYARLAAPDAPVRSAATRKRCMDDLRAAAGNAVLTVEVEPDLVGVAEAAELLGWDKRRIFTYLGRGSFPEPVAALASGRVWRRGDVEAFARTRRSRSSPVDSAGAAS